MSDVFAVMDLWGTGTCGCYSASGETDAAIMNNETVVLHPILVCPESNTNRQNYVMSENQVLLDDCIVENNDGTFLISTGNMISLDKIITSLYESEYRKGKDKLQSWARGELQYLPALGKSSEFIIPVPDRLTVDSQTVVIDALRTGLGKNCTLLWRSVAAYLGNRKRFPIQLRKNDKVAVVDIEKTGITISYLWIDIERKRGELIPAHRLFYDSESGKRKAENYPYDVHQQSSVYTVSMPYQLDNGMLIPAVKRKKSVHNIDAAVDSLYRCQCSAVIVIGKIGEPLKQTITARFHNTVFDENEESILYGCACFANCIQHKIVSYYDECEALSLVVTTKNEQYHFKTLIEDSKKLESGLFIHGKTVDGVFLNAGSTAVDFYLRLGPAVRYGRLKSISQPYSVPEDLKAELHGKSIELELKPALVAGQGRATVDISPKESKYKSIIPDVRLDWELMKEARDKSIPITVEYLEENMQRSFPPDIPYAKAKDYISPSIGNYIRGFISNPNSNPAINLNSPVWPNQNKKDVSKFVKLNTFGVPVTGYDGLPSYGRYGKEIYYHFFDAVDRNFSSGSGLMKVAAWTYHPDSFPRIMEYVRSHLKRMVRGSGGNMVLPPEEASFIANMFVTGDDALLFMSAFQKKISRMYSGGIVTGGNNWYRAAYQIMMSNPEIFNQIMKNGNEDLYKILNALIYFYYANASSRRYIVCSTICKVLCFLLKARSVDSSFCKAGEEDVLSFDSCYFALLNLLSSAGNPEVVKEAIRKYNRLLGIQTKSADVKSIISVFEKVFMYLGKEIQFPELRSSLIEYYDILIGKVERSDENIGLRKIIDSIYKRNNGFAGNTKISQWGGILNNYLNGKGNLNIPVAALGSDGNVND